MTVLKSTQWDNCEEFPANYMILNEIKITLG